MNEHKDLVILKKRLTAEEEMKERQDEEALRKLLGG